MLIAPAGYGKTTLAEQWVARDGRVGIWYTARSASTDVAALALGIARAATALIDDSDHRLREHLRALPAPAENVQTLAEILSEDLSGWPANAWLVLDDYHEITPEPKAEDFIEALVALSPVQFLIASRVRPRWVASKRVLYGEVLELTQPALAMDSDEASDVLADRSASSAAGLTALAQGWPAVIGLASASAAEINPDLDPVPESLYRFFADEVFGALDVAIQKSLSMLSIVPALDREVIVSLLGDETADATCAAALDVGLFVERGAVLELHPLARVFLDERGKQLGHGPDTAAAEKCLDIYRQREDWDACFELIMRAELTSALDGLIGIALDDLLETARLSTLETWCNFASGGRAESAINQLARAEVRLRDGRHLEASAYAEMAASDASLAFRALSVAGRAAHLASREEAGLALFQRAERVAATEDERRDAKWGQLACSIDLERPDSGHALDELSAGVGFADVRELVRMATHRIYLQLRTGALDLDEADTANRVLGALRDPIVETSFLSAYSIALALSARYAEAESAARALWLRAEQFRLDFARPYALCGMAMAHAGQRNWLSAESVAKEALERAEALHDVHAVLLSRSVLLRLYAQRNQLSAGLEVVVADTHGALNASVAEAMCSRALVLACAGRITDARELIVCVADMSTKAVEPAVLVPAVDAVCAVRGGESDSVDRVIALEATAFATGAVDLLVTSYRACPELLPVLLRSDESRPFRNLVERVGDGDLARAVGHPLATNDDRQLLLSPREREVFELLRSGFTNRQIAKVLFIEESTVKVHAHHIYDKLGVRSRSALTVQAALERGAQATSAIETSSDDASPEL
jgi:DNA-binding NarL/FixJ family response regulator